ncbi:transglutaminase N-terminal domain-containing protein [Klebsiella variicola]|uniref:transglutaminase N-terminal domain-containing protein n=1 Tax=Klebsiella variicola TaxID=244366 RepID=UPI000D74C29B|nr:hypothetical protein DMS23_07915 [Klebsiella variicola]
MKYKIRNVTEYHYPAPVMLCYNMAHLFPRNTHNQRYLVCRVVISLTPAYQREGADYFGNRYYTFHCRLFMMFFILNLRLISMF